MNKKQLKPELGQVAKGFRSLPELHKKDAFDPQLYFEKQLQNELLKIRIKRGEKSAGIEYLMHLRHRILHSSASALDMLEVVSILERIVNNDLALRVLYEKKRGRSKRTAILCLDICQRVLQVSREQNLPIRDSTDHGKSDAVAVVAEEREQARSKPWAYDTVKHYHDQGIQLFSQIQDEAVKSIIKATEFIERLEETPEELMYVIPKSRPIK